MKIPRDPYIFWKYFAFPFVFVFLFFLAFISDGAILFGCMFFLLFTAGCARVALGFERLGHEGHGFEFTAAGIKEECSFGLVRYHRWDEFKLRSVVFSSGRRRIFLLYR